MWAGGPPKPVTPILPHSSATVRSGSCAALGSRFTAAGQLATANRAAPSSAPGELGLALLDEGEHALGEVRGFGALLLERRLELEQLL